MAGVVVLFDIGNCLYDPWRTFPRTMEAIGRADLISPILERFGVYPDQPGRHDKLLQAFGMSAEEMAAYYHVFFHHPVFHRGVPEVLDRLRDKGAHLGVVSDGHFDTQLGKLEAWGLAAKFEPELTFIGSLETDLTRRPGTYDRGIQLEATKHDIATFQTILAHIEKFCGAAAQSCFMVGDDFTRDALHPTRAGLNGVWCVANEQARNTQPPDADVEAVQQIESLTQMEAIIFPPDTGTARSIA
ncbi:HAD family hydrolase [Candidatus Eisenbacteria bacterium]|uniref:HAD family hydrolase n=1 Tax=Eiseniibacteriota bacterium TaxID=2212470 RepID=A0ABV6YJZ8_UNCEI